MSNNVIAEIKSVLDEVERLQQLNYELLEQLNIIFAHINKNKLEIADKEKLAGLLNKAMVLLSEIHSNPPKDYYVQKVSRRKFTEKTNRQRLYRTFAAVLY